MESGSMCKITQFDTWVVHTTLHERTGLRNSTRQSPQPS